MFSNFCFRTGTLGYFLNYKKIMLKHEEIYFKSNKELWNKKTAFHKESAFYDLAEFKKGRNVLNDIELKKALIKHKNRD